MSIHYRILKACDFSPRHKSQLLRELNALERPTVARCAALMNKLCKRLSIADFPNPFPREEPDSMLWEEIFLGRTQLTDDAPAPANAPSKGWPKAWEGEEDPEKAATVHPDDAGVPETPLDPNAPQGEGDPNIAKPDLPVMDTPPADPVAPGSEGPAADAPGGDAGPPVLQSRTTDPLAEIIGDSSDAGAPEPAAVNPTPPVDPVENSGQGVADDDADVVDMQTDPEDVEPAPAPEPVAPR